MALPRLSALSALRFLVAGAAWGYVAPALASEEGAKAGLPQLDATLYAGQLFWLLLTFGVFYLIVKRVALPRIQQVQATRRDVLKADLEAAAVASEKAKALREGYEQALAKARAEARRTVTEITSAAAAEAAARQDAQAKAVSRRVADSVAVLGAAREAALRDVPAQAKELAEALAVRLSGGRAS